MQKCGRIYSLVLKIQLFSNKLKSYKNRMVFFLNTSLNFISDKKPKLSCSVRRCQISLTLAGSSGSTQIASPSSNVSLLTECVIQFLYLVPLNTFKCLFIHPYSSFFYRRFDEINNLVILWNHNTFLYYYSLVIYSSVSTLFINIYYNFSWTDYYKRPLVKIEQAFITL